MVRWLFIYLFSYLTGWLVVFYVDSLLVSYTCMSLKPEVYLNNLYNLFFLHLVARASYIDSW
jgi:hypothetical protein